MAGDASENVLNVIDAFSIPTFKYSVDRKKFFPQTSEKKILAGKKKNRKKKDSRFKMSKDMSKEKKALKKPLKGWINVRVCWCVKLNSILPAGTI